MFLGANLALFDERVKELEIPGVIITTGGEILANDNISSITIDDTAATYDMTRYLLEKGHRHIGVIGGQVSEKQISFNRYKGCKRAIDEWQHDDRAEFTYIPCRYSMKAGYEATPPTRSPIPIFLKFQRSSFIFIQIASPIKNIPTIPKKPDFTSLVISSILSM